VGVMGRYTGPLGWWAGGRLVGTGWSDSYRHGQGVRSSLFKAQESA